MNNLEIIKKDIVNRVLASSGKKSIQDNVVYGLNLIQDIIMLEITELKEEEIKYKEKYGKLIGKIHALEKKLGRYESNDYVLLPRNPVSSLTDLIDSLLCFPDVTTLETYKAIIEAVEKDHE